MSNVSRELSKLTVLYGLETERDTVSGMLGRVHLDYAERTNLQEGKGSVSTREIIRTNDKAMPTC